MKTLLMSAFIICSLGFAGCASNGSSVNTKQGAVGGAAAGAILGGIIGHQSGRGLEGAAIGGAVGGAGGATLGSAKDEAANANKEEGRY